MTPPVAFLVLSATSLCICFLKGIYMHLFAHYLEPQLPIPCTPAPGQSRKCSQSVESSCWGSKGGPGVLLGAINPLGPVTTVSGSCWAQR